MRILEHPAALLGPPIPWERLRRILVVRPDNLGDVVMAGPAIVALRKAAGRAGIEVLASPAGSAIAGLLPGVDDVVEASVSWQHAGRQDVPVAGDLALVETLRRRRYDAAVVLTSFSQSPWPAGYVCRLAGIPVRAGTSKEFGGAGLTHWVPAPLDELHQVDRSLLLLERLGVPVEDRTLRIVVPEEAAVRSRQLLAERGVAEHARTAVVLPGASCSSRRYPAGRFAAVADGLARGGLLPVVVGASQEASLVRAVADRVPGSVSIAGDLDVPALAATVQGAEVVICNNSGGMHLAAATGTPAVVMFAGTELIEQYEPRETPARLLSVEVSCSPCRQFACPFEHECLAIAPEQVVREAWSLVGGTHSPTAS